MKYEQPEEYRFSHDSVYLARHVFNWLKCNPQFKYPTVADICSGCGVIGLDLLIHLFQNKSQLPEQIDFLEIQDIYRHYFEANQREALKTTQSKLEMNFIQKNYSALQGNDFFLNKYDLVLCNPPYFQLGQGKLSPSEFKNRCRFFIDSDFKELLQALQYSLNTKGIAFVLLRSLADHKIEYDLNSLSNQYQLEIQVDGDIRGTDVLRITKKCRF
jgi:tRNA1(Val) A37 N6-methylase TrmN6